MAKKKLQRFGEIKTFPHVFEFNHHEVTKGFPMAGHWRDTFFSNTNPIVLELGCGKGEYTVGLATRHREKNFIGVDLKGNRIWVGAKQALDAGLKNAAFIRSRIDFIDYCFAPAEVDEIWITFPDPQPQKTRERKRLTCMRFLERYRKFLKPGGTIHLKTDSSPLYEYTLEVIQENKFTLLTHTSDLYSNPSLYPAELTEIKTYYEGIFSAKGFKICYLQFNF
ncbi:MAG TPA: tRNA (guanosine(46)-N7)-methyltransferase TrmB [Bacteroidia bacterium]|jgi:tRNA (guanine-N7-)-methyltransferase|nr:tRNA (guanosine(46)-N7)-methyltransferase TrmB [Bacteroidia bacterium]